MRERERVREREREREKENIQPAFLMVSLHASYTHGVFE